MEFTKQYKSVHVGVLKDTTVYQGKGSLKYSTQGLHHTGIELGHYLWHWQPIKVPAWVSPITLPIQHPANVPGEATVDDSRPWAPVTHSSRQSSRPASFWVNSSHCAPWERWKSLFSLWLSIFLCHSGFQINLFFKKKLSDSIQNQCMSWKGDQEIL